MIVSTTPVALVPAGGGAVRVSPGVFPWAGPDGAVSSAVFSVPNAFTASKLTLSLVNFRHDFAGDVSLRLSAPSGASATLLNASCDSAWFGGGPAGAGAAMRGATYTFDDAAVPALTIDAQCSTRMTLAATSGPGVTAGTYLPVQQLAPLAGATAGTWTLTYGDAEQGEIGFFDRAVLSLTSSADGSVWTFDLATRTVITVAPAGGLVPILRRSSASRSQESEQDRRAVLKPRAGAPATGSTCTNAAAAACPQSQCYGSSSCCLASGDCGKSDTNVCDAINLLAPNGSPTTDCPTAGSCQTWPAFPPAAPGSPAGVHTDSSDGCSCPAAIPSCTTGQCWGAMRCDNATGSSCTRTGMCTGNNAGGHVNVAPVGSFCQQNGASGTFKFCGGMATGTAYDADVFVYIPPPLYNASVSPRDSFGFQIAPLGGCQPTVTYTQLLRRAAVGPAAPPSPAAPPKVCGPKDIQAVAVSAEQRAPLLGGGATAVQLSLNVSLWLPPDSSDVLSFIVPDAFTVGAVSLSVLGLRHLDASALSLVLARPDGASVALLNGNCFGIALGSTAATPTVTTPAQFAPFDGQDFTFADTARATVAASCRSGPMAGGSYRAATFVAGSAGAGLLSSLAGGPSAGTWQLQVQNAGAGGACLRVAVATQLRPR